MGGMARASHIGLLYFLMVFAAGFALGPIRVLWLEQRVGTRAAELLEMPLMVGVIWLAAGWAGRRLPATGEQLGAGLLALSLMLGFELGLVLRLRGLSIAQYLENRDPVAGAAYAASLLFFALAPLLRGCRITLRSDR
jgi:hypothetical protein